MPRFVPRQRKHKVLAREQAGRPHAPQPTANEEIIVPLSQSEKEERRRALKEELRSQQPIKISSKKQKRLDKYIENKLKKDETHDLLRKLEKENEKYEATLPDSSHLGKRSFGAFLSGSGRVAAPEKKADNKKQQQDDSDLESEDSFEAENRSAFTNEENGSVDAKIPAAISQGLGLAQPLVLDENGLPVIQTRKSKKQKRAQEEISEELPWEGFDSEPSESGHSSDDGTSSEMGESDSDESTSNPDSAESGEDDDEDDDDDQYGSEDEDSGSETSEMSGQQKLAPRKSAFKTWATTQLNQAVGHTPSYTSGEGELLPKPAPPVQTTRPIQTVKPGLLPELPRSATLRSVYSVQVERSDSVQQSRSALPIIQREQEIMEAVHKNAVVIVKGDTGSGKTTQLPQFLFEAGYGSSEGPSPGMIGITQPRRVAAVSMANRVATELGPSGKKVSYQIRFDSTVSPDTAIKFMTDGILLRELSQDLLLRKYSVIVIDEAHERSVNTDILIGMLSKVVPARMQKSKFNPDPKPLKLIIMSATLNLDDFLHEKLFSPAVRPPMVEAEGRQHRVTTHFALRSRADYVEEVIEKVRRAHKKLPKGGILVFLTGQNEIRQVSSRLRALLAPGKQSSTGAAIPRVQVAASEAPLEAEDLEIGDPKFNTREDDFDVDILTHSDEEDEDDEFDISDNEDEGEDNNDTSTGLLKSTTTPSNEPYTSVHILPLYSQLPTTEQLKVFEPPPSGARMIVLATNVAETSLTIPGIRYVFDTGRSKERKYNLDTGVQSFEIDYISKASAQQRAGRAGRTGPGHCWRLYTSAVYEQFFPDHAEPEILRAPAESIVLQLKGFAYPRPIAQFPFPTPPSASMLNKAEQLLKNLGALTESGPITDLGKQLSIYPLSPRLGKILAAGVTDLNVLWHVLTLVSALAVPEIFITEAQLDLNVSSNNNEVYTREDQQDDDERDRVKQAYGRARAVLSKSDKSSDAMKLLTAVTLYLTAADKEQVCRDFFLRPKAMAEIAQLRGQLESIVRSNNRTITNEVLAASKANVSLDSTSKGKSKIKQLNTIAASGYIDQVAVRYDQSANYVDLGTTPKPRRAIDVPYIPLVPLHDRASATLLERAVYIHPSSVLARLGVKDVPEYICYSHLQRAQARAVVSGFAASKIRMFPLTPLDGTQLAFLARDTAMIEYGKPVAKSKIEDVPGTPRRRECWVNVELRGAKGTGGYGWPLPPTKVRQVMDVNSKSGWRVEKVLS
ncbi:putative ATP-dependent RNA helicase DHR1 [Exophiala oligosperma]